MNVKFCSHLAPLRFDPMMLIFSKFSFFNTYKADPTLWYSFPLEISRSFHSWYQNISINYSFSHSMSKVKFTFIWWELSREFLKFILLLQASKRYLKFIKLFKFLAAGRVLNLHLASFPALAIIDIYQPMLLTLGEALIYSPTRKYEQKVVQALCSVGFFFWLGELLKHHVFASRQL